MGQTAYLWEYSPGGGIRYSRTLEVGADPIGESNEQHVGYNHTVYIKRGTYGDKAVVLFECGPDSDNLQHHYVQCENIEGCIGFLRQWGVSLQVMHHILQPLIQKGEKAIRERETRRHTMIRTDAYGYII